MRSKSYFSNRNGHKLRIKRKEENRENFFVHEMVLSKWVPYAFFVLLFLLRHSYGKQFKKNGIRDWRLVFAVWDLNWWCFQKRYKRLKSAGFGYIFDWLFQWSYFHKTFIEMASDKVSMWYNLILSFFKLAEFSPRNNCCHLMAKKRFPRWFLIKNVIV